MSDGVSGGEVERRNRELSTLNSIARELNRSADLDAALGATLQQAARLLGLETGWIWLVSESSGEPYLAASQSLPPGLAENPERMDGASYCYCLDTYRKGDLKGAANVNVVGCSRLAGLVGGAEGLRYHACVPLYAPEGRKLGIMNLVAADWRRLSAEDLRLLYTIGDLLSIAVERARLFEESARIGALEERGRIAREMHDTVAQGLSATTLHLESADALLETDDGATKARGAIRKALSLTRENLEETRRSMLDLRAATLSGRSLPEALRDLATELGDGDARIHFEAVNGARSLPARLEAGLYRVAQEALTNALRHAGADRVWLRLSITPEAVTLTVEDDGRGFDASAVGEDRHGLAGMRERAGLLGGELEIASRPGNGARVRVSVPLETER